MRGIMEHDAYGKLLHPVRDQRGVTLLEVLVSTVVLGIAMTGFLMALSTATTMSRYAVDESGLVHLASLEFETLRNARFEEVPFLVTSLPVEVEEVPDYLKDLATETELELGGDDRIRASGHLVTEAGEYSRDLAFDGRRANELSERGIENSRWMGAKDALAWRESDGGPIAGGPGGGGPGAGGPGGGPGAGGDIGPDDYQWIFCAFPEVKKICRVLYDNRFNVTEDMAARAGYFDYLPHRDDVWQRNFDFFYIDRVLGSDEIFEPWQRNLSPLEFVDDQAYGSSGVWVIYDNAEEPIEAGIIGVHNIDTYSDFDSTFHWPYVSEIEVYGFNVATNYIEYYRDPVSNEIRYDNVIMYFPDYLGSGFDLGRWSYVASTVGEDIVTQHRDLIHVELQFYPASNVNLQETWQKYTWWRDDLKQLATFRSSFFRNETNRVDTLPNLHDFPSHRVYDDNEDLRFRYTVPGATDIRGHFSVFNLGPNDTVTIEDGEGVALLGPYSGIAMEDRWFDAWIPGDTIVIHFRSDGSGNSYDVGWRGFEIDQVEVRWEMPD